MPENPVTVKRRALSKGIYYECEFGHPYMITECGQPWERSQCPICAREGGKKLGAELHKLQSWNKIIKQGECGYILGIPSASEIPERSLSRASFLILRILIHSTLTWVSCNEQSLLKDITALVKTEVKKTNLASFFWDHMISNLNDLQQSMAISFEDVTLLLHLIIQKVFITPAVVAASATHISLTTQDGRCNWENKFDSDYITPVLLNVSSKLEDARYMISDFHKRNHTSLLDIVTERKSSTDINDCLWKYNPQITIEMVHHNLRTSGKAKVHSSLDYFLKEEASIRSTEFLPCIVNLQQYFYNSQNCRCSQAEIRAKTIGGFISELENEKQRVKLRSLVHDTSLAWSLVKGKLLNYGWFSQSENQILVDLDLDTPLAYFIPMMADEGRCTIALVEYLVEVHNNCINKCKETITSMRSAGTTWKSVWSDRIVLLKHVRKSDLILHKDRLKAIILAHTHYSLVVGENNSNIEFDFDAMEKHVLDEFVYTKPIIRKKRLPDVVSFREDVYNERTFQKIRENVNPQVELTTAEKKSLLSQLAIMQKMKQALDHINIVIGFLSAGGSQNPRVSLSLYAKKYLQITNFDKVIGVGYNLEHTLALWHAISVELAKKRTVYNKQSPFKVNKCFKKTMSEKKSKQIAERLRQVDVQIILNELNNFIEIHVRDADEREAESMISKSIDSHFANPSKDLVSFSKHCLNDLPMNCIVDVWMKAVVYQEEMKDLSTY